MRLVLLEDYLSTSMCRHMAMAFSRGASKGELLSALTAIYMRERDEVDDCETGDICSAIGAEHYIRMLGDDDEVQQ